MSSSVLYGTNFHCPNFNFPFIFDSFSFHFANRKRFLKVQHLCQQLFVEVGIGLNQIENYEKKVTLLCCFHGEIFFRDIIRLKGCQIYGT